MVQRRLYVRDETFLVGRNCENISQSNLRIFLQQRLAEPFVLQ